jgi:hypothetical protein
MKHFDLNYLAHSNQATSLLNEATNGYNKIQFEHILEACHSSL